MTAAVDLEGLTRHYGRVRAVEELNLTVGAGEIFGLVGPNGSGKTTTLMMLSTLMRPTRGGGRIYGHDLRRRGDRIRPLIGVMFHECSLDPEATAEANLDLYLRMRGVDGGRRRQLVEEALRVADLDDLPRTPVRDFSWGMKRRVEIARALSDRPRLLLLDEPTLGLDLGFRRRILLTLEEYRRGSGAAIFFCTHDPALMDICDRLGIIVRGRLHRVEAVERLRGAWQLDEVTISPASLPPDSPRLIVDFLVARGLTPQLVDGHIRVTASDTNGWLADLLASMGRRVVGVSYGTTSLRDVITRILGESSDGADLGA